MKKKILQIFPLLLLIICLTFCAVNADYSFQVPRAETVVEVNPDGTLNVFVEYEYLRPCKSAGYNCQYYGGKQSFHCSSCLQ